MTDEVLRLSADLRRPREWLVNAGEEERRRLRRELHYSLGPQLSNQALTIGPTDVSAYANSVATRYRKPRTGLSSEEENRIYSMMRLQALAQRDGLLIASWGCNVSPLPLDNYRTEGQVKGLTLRELNAGTIVVLFHSKT
jgi:hypothetical protein